MLFKLFRWLFRKDLDNYIFDRTLKSVHVSFTPKQKEFLMFLARDNRINEIIDVFVTSSVATGMAACSKESIQQRKDWIDCYGYMKEVIAKYKEEDKKAIKDSNKVNPLTNEPFKEKK